MKTPVRVPSPARLARSAMPSCSVSPMATSWGATSRSSSACSTCRRRRRRLAASSWSSMTARSRCWPASALHDPNVAFKDVDIAILIGSRPRGPGMERRDLLAEAEIFKVQGKALNDVANRDVKVLVVGNPANTNAYIAMKSAPDLPKKNFTAMLRLDHNRAVSMLAEKSGVAVKDIEKVAVWGNHSPTMYADYRNATGAGKSLPGIINDETWYKETDLAAVGKRGAAIIDGGGLSSAASAANAAIDHVRDWVLGSNGNGDFDGRALRWLLRHPQGCHVRRARASARAANISASRASPSMNSRRAVWISR